jgi:hypothetical protein
MTYRIDAHVQGEWRPRATIVDCDKPNDAFRAYGIHKRGYNGEARSQKGRRFRAVPLD